MRPFTDSHDSSCFKNLKRYQKASFLMLPHNSSKLNEQRFEKLSRATINQFQDGLSNIDDHIRLVSYNVSSLYSHIVFECL